MSQNEKPTCPRCGYKTKKLYHRVGEKATFTSLDDWYYCERDNWIINSRSSEPIREILEAMDPEMRSVNVEDLSQEEMKKLVMDPFVKNRKEIVAYLEQIEILIDIVLNDEDENLRFLAISKLDKKKYKPTLLHIAKFDKSKWIRIHVANLVNSPELYQYLALNDQNSYVRKLVLNRIDNPEIIKQVILSDSDWKIRFDAIRKLINLIRNNENLIEESESFFYEVVKNEPNYKISIPAVEFINNQEFLKDLALHEQKAIVNRHIIEKITDEEFLVSIVNDPEIPGRDEAIPKIKNQEILNSIINEEKNRDLIEYAVLNLNDRTTLYQIARDTKYTKYFPEARVNAIFKLNDPELIEEILKSQEPGIIKIPLLSIVKDKQILLDLCKTDPDAEVRKYALNYINDKETISYVLDNDKNIEIRVRAIKKLDDTKLFEKYLEKNEDWRIRRAIVEKIKDKGILKNVIETDSSDKVRLSAIDKINDISFLSEVAIQDFDDKVRLSAENRVSKLNSLVTEKFSLKGNSEFIRRLKNAGIQPESELYERGSTADKNLIVCPYCKYSVLETQISCPNCGELLIKNKKMSRETI